MAARELSQAAEIAREAGTVLLPYMASERMETRAKGDRDVVTAADMAAEALIRTRLAEAFPGDGMLGEEGTDVAASGQRCWCIDPLDGTLNFSRMLPIWCVSLALFEGSQPVLGVIHDPIRGETFTAARGVGAFCDGLRIVTSGRSRLAEAFVHMTVDFHEGSMREGLEDLVELAPRVYRTRNIGSAALALAYVAAGRFDAMMHRYANPWDYGAGVVLIEEAGGTVTNIAGDPYTLSDRSVVTASGSELHAALLALVKPSRPSRLE